MWHELPSVLVLALLIWWENPSLGFFLLPSVWERLNSYWTVSFLGHWHMMKEKNPTNLPTQPLPLQLCFYGSVHMWLLCWARGMEDCCHTQILDLLSLRIRACCHLHSGVIHAATWQSEWPLAILHTVMSSLQGAPWCIHPLKGRLANHYHYFISTLHNSHKSLQGQMTFPHGPPL